VEDRALAVVLEVERDAALVAVDGQEGGRVVALHGEAERAP
jgi:hypothetical protein